MADFRNLSGDPGFSTLEVDHRGPHSTLEVKPGEGIEPFNSVPTTQKQSEEPLPLVVTKPWWKRYWLAIVVISILVTGGIIGGAVGGTLATKKEPNDTGNSEEAITTSSSEPKSTTSSESSTTPSPTTLTSTTISYPTVKPTATPDADAEPDDPIWVGTSEEKGQKFHIAFALDGTKNASCNYGVIPFPESQNPCSHSVLLPDGFLYSWEGCGGGTWMMWKNPESDDPGYHKLHEGNCEWKPTTFDCGKVVIKASWLCGNDTLG
ncbi:uncharacterized protein FIESC28_11610 [Fusarium coffeatum]|uniref:Uncharacterized protein n=1 Tax=Fusarium coffeatum TaxID=231269 RepID=A0A366QH78_9HYPO|nr:uncharacterized protein FIESC28_11610 [Fusarium coffeatum]RBR04187.1 hypothetical protein FIESC28_11610 [Fusarium coffeatum]